jgi:hypothetical protein
MKHTGNGKYVAKYNSNLLSFLISLKEIVWRLNMVAQTYNRSYSGRQIRKMVAQGQHRQKVQETPSQPMAGYGGTQLSSQLYKEVQIRGSKSRPAHVQSETLSQK